MRRCDAHPVGARQKCPRSRKVVPRESTSVHIYVCIVDGPCPFVTLIHRAVPCTG